MDNSESQFNELLGDLIVRVNKMLSKQNEMVSIGLLLRNQNHIDVFLADHRSEWTLSEAVQNLQNGMVENVAAQPAMAGCIAYPDYENNQVIANMENKEHYCAKIRIPVSAEPSLHLDVEGIQVEDGEIFIFGEARN